MVNVDVTKVTVHYDCFCLTNSFQPRSLSLFESALIMVFYSPIAGGISIGLVMVLIDIAAWLLVVGLFGEVGVTNEDVGDAVLWACFWQSGDMMLA